jgi:hypothetical protein
MLPLNHSREYMRLVAGQLAYEHDCDLMPVYHDGTTRKTWAQLCDVARWSWNRNPAPRSYRKAGGVS